MGWKKKFNRAVRRLASGIKYIAPTLGAVAMGPIGMSTAARLLSGIGATFTIPFWTILSAEIKARMRNDEMIVEYKPIGDIRDITFMYTIVDHSTFVLPNGNGIRLHRSGSQLTLDIDGNMVPYTIAMQQETGGIFDGMPIVRDGAWKEIKPVWTKIKKDESTDHYIRI